jgi:HAMP domain-containing protein
MARFTSNTIYNEMIMSIIGLFAKLDLETQITTVKTLAQTIERQHNISQMERESLEEQEHLLKQQHEMMQALSDLEEKSGLYK